MHETWIARICMTLLPEVCLGPRINPLHFLNNPDYDPDPGTRLR